jgi:hypothetical protein
MFENLSKKPRFVHFDLILTAWNANDLNDSDWLTIRHFNLCS